MQTLGALLLGCLLVTGLGCGGGTASTSSESAEAPPDAPGVPVTAEMGHPHVGDPAPDFEVTTPEGERLKLSDLRGSVVALSFVTSWCPFSQAEQPHLAELAREYQGSSDVRVVIVDIDQTEEGYRRFLERVEMPGPVYYTPSAEAVLSYVPPEAVPTITRGRWRVLVTSNLVIDREGVIRFFALTDTVHFDAELQFPRRAIAELVHAGG